MLTYSKYPFMADYEQYVKKVYGVVVPPRELAQSRELAELARARLLEAVKKGEVGEHGELTSEKQVLSFYLALAAAAGSGSKRLVERLALAESARAARFVKAEDTEELITLASALGLPVERKSVRLAWGEARSGRKYFRILPYAVKVSDYLKVISGDQDPSWSLVNSMALGGYVYMDDSRLRELITKAVYRRLMVMASQLEAEGTHVAYLAGDAMREIQATVSKEGPATMLRPRNLLASAMPPCMSRISENPAAYGDRGLYAYLAFLAELGADSDQLSDIIEQVIHVDRTRAKVMAQSLLLSGLGTTYRTYRCSVMQSMGLCPTDCGYETPTKAYKANLRKRRLAEATDGVSQGGQPPPALS